ncbi:uncharacterized protein LOC136070259 [Quercus suber]|uniref:uncharacterized protein LOC136070259 n=1 Tax=Quercus suber TaxID=58331 RepID=UPI0032DF65AC
MFPSTKVHHISGSISNHSPLWICTNDENARFYRKRKPFRFEAIWMRDEGCEVVIKYSWEDHTRENLMGRMVKKLEACWLSLQTWSKHSFGNIHCMLQSNHSLVRSLRAEVHDLMVKEECLWQQRSRVNWLKAEDLNIAYFHRCTNQRNQRNFIPKLILDSGEVVEDEQKIGEAFVHHFQSIFQSANTAGFDPILQGIEPKVTTQMNANLTRPFTAMEVEQALKQMKPMTAPSPDGMPPIFYKSYWNTVGSDVIDASLSKADNGELRGVSLRKEGPKITHLFFTVDSLLFCRANDIDCQMVMNILTKYEEASGQKINRAKTQLFFSTNTQEDIKNRVKDLVGVEVVTQYEKYLGLPSFVGTAKKETFSYIRERVWHKIQGWKEKLLSQAGREILIKAVIQAMPTFTMGCFKLPKNLCKDIEALTRKFWWEYSGEVRKIHWIAWKKLCLPKVHGGLGFRDLEKYNLALLGKQIWRLIHNTDSMFYKVFKARFFPTWSVLESGVKTNGSYAWHSILKVREVVKQGAYWQIGDGTKVQIRGDKWLPDMSTKHIISPQKNLPMNAKVCALTDEDGPRWIKELLLEKNLILSILNKIKHFLWRACHESLPTKKNLLARNVTRKALCEWCNKEVEDAVHALWGCQVLKEVWWEEEILRNQLSMHFVDFRDLWIGITKLEEPNLVERFTFVAWSIWNKRNATRMQASSLPFH